MSSSFQAITRTLTVCAIIGATTLQAHAIAISPWPSADSVGTDISAGILAQDSGFEPSGIAWSDSRQTFVVVDDGGNVAEIDENGTVAHFWTVGYNLEGIAIPNHTGDIAYLADENNSTIREMNLTTGTLTGTSWNVSAYISNQNNLGLEALEWLPDGAHAFGSTSMGGIFVGGWQLDGNIYAFEPEANGNITFLGTLVTNPDYTDLAGLDYSAETNTLYGVYDSSDALQEYAPTGGDETGEYLMPSTNQEGIAVIADCNTQTATITIADDAGRVITYTDYPVTCAAAAIVADADGDGVDANNDCNDADASINTLVTYYRDADNDGYGAQNDTTSACSTTPPTGYVTNNTDLYDTARIEIFGDNTDNDGDAQIDEYNNLKENGVHPLYATEDPKTSTSVLHYSIMPGGNMIVIYRDGSRYSYTALPFGRQCVASPVSLTNYVLASCDGKYAIINALNGQNLARASYARRADAITWASTLVASW